MTYIYEEKMELATGIGPVTCRLQEKVTVQSQHLLVHKTLYSKGFEPLCPLKGV